MQIKIVLGIASLFTAHATASAQTTAETAGPWYVSGALSAGRLSDANQVVSNAPTPGSTLRLSNDIETDWGGQIAVGRAFGPVRAEIEYGYQENQSGSYTTLSPFVATLPQDGQTDIQRFMLNGYFDLLSPESQLRPFVGMGAGTAEVSVLRINAVAAAPTAPPQRRIDFSDDGFAWQAMAGVAWRITPSLSFTAQYRWFDRGDVEGRDLRGERVVIGVATHNIDAGIRYSF